MFDKFEVLGDGAGTGYCTGLWYMLRTGCKSIKRLISVVLALFTIQLEDHMVNIRLGTLAATAKPYTQAHNNVTYTLSKQGNQAV